MTLIGVMAYRPSLLGNVSPASFHRVVEGSKGTVMIDEAKTIADDSLMRQFLNSGFNNSGRPVLSPTVPRYNADTGRMEHFRTNYFKAFAGVHEERGPKILLSTLGDRQSPVSPRSAAPPNTPSR